MKHFNMQYLLPTNQEKYFRSLWQQIKKDIGFCFFAPRLFGYPYRTQSLILSKNTPDWILEFCIEKYAVYMCLKFGLVFDF